MQVLKSFIQKLFAPWKSHPDHIDYLIKTIRETKLMITERTTVHADINYKSGMDTIIVVGRYRNHDYVRCFAVESKDFHEFVEIFRRIEPRGRVGRIDVPFPSFSGVVERIKHERGQR
ncbi:hypothetical protein KA005_18730 [bacterium]|nr:hypothetical protein [bacterium]